MSTDTTTERKTFTSSAGPRQTKQVESALRHLRSRGQSYTELSGVIGVSEQRYSYQTIVGGTSEACQAAIRRIGDKYDWEVTRENYKELEADILEAARTLVLPIIDKRRTPEEDAALKAEISQRQADSIATETAKRTTILELATKMRIENPWAVAYDSKLSNPARAAKNIKIELGRKFPGIAFRAVSDRFAGGNSVDVTWTNGPTTKEVDAVIDHYKQDTFDGMDDSYNYDSSASSQAHAEVFGSAKYVGGSREIPTADREIVITAIQADHETAKTDRSEAERLANVAFSRTSFPPGAIITGACFPNDGHCDYLVTFTAPAGQPTATPSTPAAVGYEIQKHFHTKREFDFWLVVWSERVTNFDDLRSSAEKLGGWYSRKWGSTPGGMAFLSESLASDWARLRLGRVETPTDA